MERTDDLQLKGLRILQDSDLFCFGTDAVLLADFAKVNAGDTVVDLGTGGGILLLLMYGRQPGATFRGIEIQAGLARLAQRSIALNGLEAKMEALHGDMAQAAAHFGGSNDVAIANPPYEKDGDGQARGAESHLIARKEVKIDLAGVCAAAAGVLKGGGRFYMIHKASRLVDVMDEMRKSGIEPKLLRLVQPRADSEPRYALLCGVKGGKSHLRLMPALVLHDTDGNESEELRRIYGRP